MILVKTESGQQVVKSRSVALSPRQRAAFILFDGKRDVAEVMQASQVSLEDVEALIELGLLTQVASPLASGSGQALNSESDVPASPEGSVEDSVSAAAQQRYQTAYPIAAQLTASLGLRGFGLNLAVEGTRTFEELQRLVPKIKAAVGPEKAATLVRALAG